MILTFRFSATGSGSNLTYAEVGTTPATKVAATDLDSGVAGSNIESVAGPITPARGRLAKATSSVETANQRSNLLLVLETVGDRMKSTGFAQHGLQYISHSPVSFLLEIETLELDGDYATLDFRLEQPEDGDHLREISDETAPISLPEDCDFERVPAHLTLFRLQAKLIKRGGRPHLQIHSTHEREFVTVKPEISPRDFEVDPRTHSVRYLGHLDSQGQRVRTIEISIDPGRTSDENNLILTLLGTQSTRKHGHLPYEANLANDTSSST